MSIIMDIHPDLRHFTNHQSIIEVAGKNVGACLEDLILRFPDIKPELFDGNNKLRIHIDVYVNTESSYPDELKTPVKDGDRLTIVIPLIGG